jgi:diguanylate cyclase (GGDEF)-like protein/PAS domain S-box-containing protein
MQNKKPKRILIIDDVVAIHEDFRRILSGGALNTKFEEALAAITNKNPLTEEKFTDKYILDSAYQGEEGFKLVEKAVAQNDHYALAFVDMRMPPGWDGLTTIKKIWGVDPEMQIVICTAFSDYSWEDISKELTNTDNFLILKKPFDVVEIRQLAASLTTKWELKKQVQYQVEHLQELVKERSRDLDNSLSLSNAALESTHEGIIVTNKEGKVILMNRLFLKLWGLEEGSVQVNDAFHMVLIKLSELVVESQLLQEMLLDLSKEPKIGIANEWLLKNNKILELYTHPQILHNKIVGCVFSFLDITEQKLFEKKLHYQATHDDLTGLPNRSLISDRIQQAIAYSKQDNTLIGILMLNLDNFKRINDTLGQETGDILLQDVASKLLSILHDTDSISRTGGDEFILVITSYDNENALMSRINKIFSLFSIPLRLKDQEIIVTTSMGVSIYPKDGEDVNTLLKNANIALYHAKELGRNNIQFFQPQLGQELFQKVDLISSLHQALTNNEFVLHYQPLLDLNTNRIMGVEALVRWKHPTLGLLQPDTFIPLAERSGIINELGKWVLRTACTQNKEWQKTINPELNMAINISGYQFRKDEFVDEMIHILNELKLDPHTITLEMTESVILGNQQDISNKMHQLKQIGVHFAIDDFGTGYSTLNYLKYYPFDSIKIDKSFIQGVITNKGDKYIVEAIINMARTLGVMILAEGVESIEQVNFLKDRHANHVQGYFFSKPIDAEKCTELLKNSSNKDSIPSE